MPYVEKCLKYAQPVVNAKQLKQEVESLNILW